VDARDEVERLAARARALVRAGEPDAAADALDALLRVVSGPAGSALCSQLRVDADDRGRLVVEAPFDPVLVDRLGHVAGARRAEGAWRVARGGQPALVDLLELLAAPPCSPEGCVLGEDAPPSAPHRDAHAAWCS
jgi:hypothetical protein